jgi:hypothetical protein
MSEKPAIVMTEREHLVRAIRDGLRKIDEHDRKIAEQETKRDEREVEVGTALKALKAQKPKGIKWEHYLEECGIEVHRSRADQLIRIADGRTTVEEERDDTAERTAKSRADLPLRSGEDAGDPEASAEEPLLLANPDAIAEDIMSWKAAFAENDAPPETNDAQETYQTILPPARAEVAKLIRAWVQASPEVKREFVRERWDEIARARKQLDANGAAHEDRWMEGDAL